MKRVVASLLVVLCIVGAIPKPLARAEAPPVRPAATVALVRPYWQQETQQLQKFLSSIGKPKEWAGYIADSARAERLSPWLIAAVIDVESKYNQYEVGTAGDMGLMQVMPDTAEWMAKDMGLTNYDPMEPATNIRLGAHYLSVMVRTFGDPGDSLAAYNGGPGNMSLEDCRTYARVVMQRKMALEQKWGNESIK